jgi:hypothetical protein
MLSNKRPKILRLMTRRIRLIKTQHLRPQRRRNLLTRKKMSWILPKSKSTTTKLSKRRSLAPMPRLVTRIRRLVMAMRIRVRRIPKPKKKRKNLRKNQVVAVLFSQEANPHLETGIKTLAVERSWVMLSAVVLRISKRRVPQRRRTREVAKKSPTLLQSREKRKKKPDE